MLAEVVGVAKGDGNVTTSVSNEWAVGKVCLQVDANKMHTPFPKLKNNYTSIFITGVHTK